MEAWAFTETKNSNDAWIELNSIELWMWCVCSILFGSYTKEVEQTTTTTTIWNTWESKTFTGTHDDDDDDDYHYCVWTKVFSFIHWFIQLSLWRLPTFAQTIIMLFEWKKTLPMISIKLMFVICIDLLFALGGERERERER